MSEADSQNRFLPTSLKEMQSMGWEQADVIIFSGDAYVDHPSFGTAVIARMLESAGYQTAVIPQPNWQDDLRDFKKLGKPRLFFAVSAGNMDSMVNHYTAFKRLRHDDAYTPGNRHGARPDYPGIVYTRILKSIFPDVPVLLGGIEASMRRFTHYDYWQNRLMPGILSSSGADCLIYGMAEYPVVYLADALAQNKFDKNKESIPQLQYLDNNMPDSEDAILLHSHTDCQADPHKFAENFVQIEQNANALQSRRVIQENGQGFLVSNPAMPPLSTKKLDKIYNLPYTHQAHPRYDSKESIPAYEMIRHSLTTHRGCFGGCSFCTIAAHQGRFISSRSEKSVIREVEKLSQLPDFKGHITDAGGPSANMYGMHGVNMNLCRTCKRSSCIFPNICNNLNTDHSSLINLYNRINKHAAVKKLSIGSGIRYDLIINSREKYREAADTYLEQIVRFHVSGRLKVAPEHTEDRVLKLMRKPGFIVFRKLNDRFRELNRKYQLRQQLIPYFISSHPGCSLADMQKLEKESRSLHLQTSQSQDFTPSPMTLSTVMYYTGFHPNTKEPIISAKKCEDKKAQNRYFYRADKD